MAVASTVHRITYSGNASAVTEYVVPFRYDDPSWLSVIRTNADGSTDLLANGVGYALTGDGFAMTGRLVTTVAVPSSAQLTIARYAPALQTLVLPPNSPLPAPDLERALDRIILALQDRSFDRALQFPETEPEANDTQLPDPAARRNCVLGFDSATGEAVLFRLPVPIVPVSPPGSGTYVLASVDGVMTWKGTVNCS